MASLRKLFSRRFAPALIAIVATAAWWSLTILAPAASADPLGVAHALSRLASLTGWFDTASRS